MDHESMPTSMVEYSSLVIRHDTLKISFLSGWTVPSLSPCERKQIRWSQSCLHKSQFTFMNDPRQKVLNYKNTKHMYSYSHNEYARTITC